MRRFQKKAGGLEALTAEGRVVRVRDETAAMADVRLRKGAYALKKKRAACKHAGNHAEAIRFGLPAADGGGHFGGHKRFTKDEFIRFLRNAHAKFGKTAIMLDRAPPPPARGKGSPGGGGRDGRRGRTGAPPARMSGPQRHGRAVAADEARSAFGPVRQVRQDAPRHKAAAGGLHSTPGHVPVPVPERLAAGRSATRPAPSRGRPRAAFRNCRKRPPRRARSRMIVPAGGTGGSRV